MIVKVFVDSEEIDTASDGADAIVAAFEKAGVEAMVVSGCWYSHGSNGELPKAAREFIAAFDAGEPVAPFSFEVEI